MDLYVIFILCNHKMEKKDLILEQLKINLVLLILIVLILLI